MRLQKLEISNFLSFGNSVQVDLTKTAPPVLVQGITTSPEKSNGAGKSSLFESFYWCLTGKTIRGVTAGDVIRKGQKVCSVGADFTYRDKPMRVLREYSEAKKRLVLVNDGKLEEFHDMKQGTQRLFDVLGLTPELLSMVCFSGRKFMTFSRLLPKDRADLIDVLAQGSKWEEARTIAAREAKDLGKDLDLAAATALAAKQAIVDFQSKRREKQSELVRVQELHRQALQEAQNSVDLSQSELDTLEIEMATFSKPVDQLNEISAMGDEITQVQKEISTLEGDSRVLNSEIRDLNRKSDEKFDERKYENEINRITNQLETGLCAECGQKLPHNHDEDTAIGRLAEIEEAIQKEKKSWQERVAQARGAVASLEEQLKQKAAKKAELEQLLSDLVNLKQEAEVQARESDAERVKLEQQIILVRRELNNKTLMLEQAKNTSHIAVLERDIRNLEDRVVEEETKKEQADKKIVELQDSLTMAKYWSQGFNDIRFSLFNSTIKTLEDLLNAFCSQQGLDFEKIEIDSWKVTSDKRTKPEINLRVFRNGQSLSIDALSEGETQRVDLACYFAISALVEQYVGFNIDLAILDEPLTGLDLSGKQQVFDILASMAERRQVFVIDHDSTFKSLFTNTITVQKAETSTVSIV